MLTWAIACFFPSRFPFNLSLTPDMTFSQITILDNGVSSTYYLVPPGMLVEATGGESRQTPPESHIFIDKLALQSNGRYSFSGAGAQELYDYLVSKEVTCDRMWSYSQMGAVLPSVGCALTGVDRSQRPAVWTIEYRP